MADTGATEILDALMRNMREIISTKTIVGDPIESNGVTILPLMRVAMGFGAGAGHANKGDKQDSATDKPGTGMSGGGGGGGVSITPIGFLVVDANRAVMVTPKVSKWDWVAEAVPDLIDKLINKRQDSGKKRGPASEPHMPSNESPGASDPD